jgi:hypothetical protein
VPVSAWIRHGWTGRASDPVAKLANERVEDAGKTARGLRFALSLLSEPDRAQNERMKPQTEKAIQPWKRALTLSSTALSSAIWKLRLLSLTMKLLHKVSAPGGSTNCTNQGKF